MEGTKHRLRVIEGPQRQAIDGVKIKVNFFANTRKATYSCTEGFYTLAGNDAIHYEANDNAITTGSQDLDVGIRMGLLPSPSL